MLMHDAALGKQLNEFSCFPSAASVLKLIRYTVIEDPIIAKLHSKVLVIISKAAV